MHLTTLAISRISTSTAPPASFSYWNFASGQRSRHSRHLVKQGPPIPTRWSRR